MDAIEALTSRRSPLQLVDPPPGEAAMEAIFRAALRAPDHGKLRPWRFIVLRGEARARFGAVIAEALKRRQPDAPDNMVERERQKPARAPLIVVVAAALQQGHKVPVVEQMLSAGAAAQNVMLAAHAMGFGAAWKTGEPAYDPFVKEALGLSPNDAIVGFIYLGTPGASPPPMPPPELAEFVREWRG